MKEPPLAVDLSKRANRSKAVCHVRGDDETVDLEEHPTEPTLWKSFTLEGRRGRVIQVNVKNFTWGLYKPDYTCLLIGRRRTGKTTWLKEFMRVSRPWFPNVLVFTKSVADSEYRKYVPEGNIICGLPAAKLKAVIEYQKERLTAYRKGEIEGNINLLIIIDDCVSEGMRWIKELDELFYEGRHLKV